MVGRCLILLIAHCIALLHDSYPCIRALHSCIYNNCIISSEAAKARQPSSSRFTPPQGSKPSVSPKLGKPLVSPQVTEWWPADCHGNAGPVTGLYFTRAKAEGMKGQKTPKLINSWFGSTGNAQRVCCQEVASTHLASPIIPACPKWKTQMDPAAGIQ